MAFQLAYHLKFFQVRPKRLRVEVLVLEPPLGHPLDRPSVLPSAHPLVHQEAFLRPSEEASLLPYPP